MFDNFLLTASTGLEKGITKSLGYHLSNAPFTIFKESKKELTSS